MVELSTLTGAIIVALGHERAGLFSKQHALSNKLRAAGSAIGEKLWRLPLGPNYDKMIDSDIADMRNVTNSRDASSITAAQFLQRFVQEGVAWAHLDIAGMAWIEQGQQYEAEGRHGLRRAPARCVDCRELRALTARWRPRLNFSSPDQASLEDALPRLLAKTAAGGRAGGVMLGSLERVRCVEHAFCDP